MFGRATIRLGIGPHSSLTYVTGLLIGGNFVYLHTVMLKVHLCMNKPTG